MNVYWISSAGVDRHSSEDLDALLSKEGGFVWVDIPECKDEETRILLEIFRFHPLAVQACRERTHLPKVHPYADYVFVALQFPEAGNDGEIRLFELNQFVGRRYLVTVHEPVDGINSAETTMHHTEKVLQRMESGRYHPTLPAELSYTIVSGLTRRIEALLSVLASKVDVLEQQVIKGHLANPEKVLETMFRLRHGLLALRTIAATAREGYARIVGRCS